MISIDRRRIMFCLAALCLFGTALAHHSFAVFFDSSRLITVSGVVTEFKFVNPHGTIVLERKDKAGPSDIWKVETNAPTVLRRMGWSQESIKPGERVTVEGWGARDGSRYMRMRRVTRADGSLIGRAPMGFNDEGAAR
jgi:hypothetical protein